MGRCLQTVSRKICKSSLIIPFLNHKLEKIDGIDLFIYYIDQGLCYNYINHDIINTTSLKFDFKLNIENNYKRKSCKILKDKKNQKLKNFIMAAKNKCHLVFPVINELFTEDLKIKEILEYYNISYLGNQSNTIKLINNKIACLTKMNELS